jgi:starch-binding outer membrane protein, SusD/RagB family
MKNKIYKKVVFLLAAVIVFASCSDLLDAPDIKVNPNAPADAPIDVLLSGALVGLSVVHEDTDTRLSYMWSGQLSGLSRQHAGFGIYNVAASTFDNSWSILYSATGNARIIQEKAAPLNNKVALGIGQVMEALLIAKVTVLYGDVPYSQAFDVIKFPKPVFDKQADVYAALIKLLDNAYANLSSPLGSVSASQEFIFGGDASKWASAAKTLQARLYLHLGDNANAIASALNGIPDAAGDALIPHGSAQTIDNNLNFDFFENSRPGDTGFDGAFLPAFMKTRLDGVAQVPDEAKRNSATDETALFNHFFQFGIYGAATSLDPNTVDGMFTADAPHPLLTFYENQLILAEAYARQGGASIPLAVAALNSVRQELAGGYINGKVIDAAYQGLGIQYDDYSAVDFTPGGLANPVSTGRDQQKGLLYEIISQKYILSLAQYNVFTDVRRLAKATPVVQLPIPPTFGTQIPSRFIYPQNEINTNGANVPSPLPDQYVKLPIFQ